METIVWICWIWREWKASSFAFFLFCIFVFWIISVDDSYEILDSMRLRMKKEWKHFLKEFFFSTHDTSMSCMSAKYGLHSGHIIIFNILYCKIDDMDKVRCKTLVNELLYVSGTMMSPIHPHIYDWFLIIRDLLIFDLEYHPDEGSDEDSNSEKRKEEGPIRRIFFPPLTGKRILMLLCVAVSIDPLFFYIPVINNEKKCLAIDKNLRAAALCLRALPDAAFALHSISSGFRLYPFVELYSVQVFVYSFASILVAVFLMLPIPQVRKRLTILRFLYFIYSFDCWNKIYRTPHKMSLKWIYLRES